MNWSSGECVASTIAAARSSDAARPPSASPVRCEREARARARAGSGRRRSPTRIVGFGADLERFVRPVGRNQRRRPARHRRPPACHGCWPRRGCPAASRPHASTSPCCSWAIPSMVYCSSVRKRASSRVTPSIMRSASAYASGSPAWIATATRRTFGSWFTERSGTLAATSCPTSTIASRLGGVQLGVHASADRAHRLQLAPWIVELLEHRTGLGGVLERSRRARPARARRWRGARA